MVLTKKVKIYICFCHLVWLVVLLNECALNVVPLMDGVETTQWVITGHLPLRLLIVIRPKS